MESNALFDWLLDWKTGLSWGLACFALAFWLLGYSLHRNLVALRKQVERIAKRIETLPLKARK